MSFRYCQRYSYNLGEHPIGHSNEVFKDSKSWIKPFKFNQIRKLEWVIFFETENFHLRVEGGQNTRIYFYSGPRHTGLLKKVVKT